MTQAKGYRRTETRVRQRKARIPDKCVENRAGDGSEQGVARKSRVP